MRRPPQPSASLLKARWALLSLRSPLNRDQCDFGPCRREGGQPRATRNLPETKDNSPSNERTVFILVLFGDIRCCSGSPFPTAVSVSVFGVVLCGPFLLLVACMAPSSCGGTYVARARGTGARNALISRHSLMVHPR